MAVIKLRQPSKLHNEWTDGLDGQRYRSKREAAYANELRLRLRAGDIAGYQYEPRVKLFIGDHELAQYIMVDFLVTLTDGSQEYHEVKGYRDPRSPITRLWLLKREILEANHPDVPYRVVG